MWHFGVIPITRVWVYFPIQGHRSRQGDSTADADYYAGAFVRTSVELQEGDFVRIIILFALSETKQQ